MRPQFFPWLFDDRHAWEKSFEDPRYNYELPIDGYMALYQLERNPENTEDYAGLPTMMPAMPSMPMQVAVSAPFPMPEMPTMAAMPAVTPEPKDEKADGILSQDEIDALLSGL